MSVTAVSNAAPTVPAANTAAVAPVTSTASTATPVQAASSAGATSPAMLATQVLGNSKVTPQAESSRTKSSHATVGAASTSAAAAKPKATLAQICKNIPKKHKWNGGKYDCWTLSDRLFKDMSKNGYKTRVIQFGTSFAGNHRQVQYQSKGKWVNFPYDQMKFDKLFRVSHVPSHFSVIKHN